MTKPDTRYPYTYACDLIRHWAGCNEHGTKLSRLDASQISSRIAEILGIDDEVVSKKLADYYLANEEALTQQGVEEVLNKLSIFRGHNPLIK